jgi:tetratricopeptide (TPR) repeat protein
MTHAGRYDEALDVQDKARATMLRVYGDDNDTVAAMLDNHGYTLALVGRYRDARIALEQALAIPSAIGSTHGNAQCDLARVDLAEGHPDLAITGCEHGLALIRDGATGFAVAVNEDPLAAGYLAAHRNDDALRQSRECLADFRKDGGKDTTDLVPCLRIEGAALIELGRAKEATPELEHALALQQGHLAPPGAIADLKFRLSRALIASGGDRARAAQLADEAHAELVRYPFEQSQLAEVDAWRATVLPR